MIPGNRYVLNHPTMSYLKRIPVDLRYWLQDKTPTPICAPTQLKVGNKTYSFVLDDRSEEVRNLNFTLLICGMGIEFSASETPYANVVHNSITKTMMNKHVNLAKWMLCRLVLKGNMLCHTLWAENKQLSSWFIKEDIKQCLELVPTPFTVSFLVIYTGFEGGVRLMPPRILDGLLRDIVTLGYWDLLIPFVEAMCSIFLCKKCAWGTSRGYVRRCIHYVPSISRNTIVAIPKDVWTDLTKLYPWIVNRVHNY